jgi:hypothetical protein
MNLFANVFGKTNATQIIVQFKNGQSATYTTNILNLLKSDPDTEYIINAETGELIYHYELT